MTIRTLSALCSLAALCLLPAASFAQNRITLDVAVSVAGKPVPGLAATDFTVTDNKKPVQNLSLEPAGETNIVLVLDTQDSKLADGPNIVRDLRTYFARNGGKLAHPHSVVLWGMSGLQATEAPTTDGAKIIAFLDKANTTQTSGVPESAGGAGDLQRLNNAMLAFTNVINGYTRNGGRNMLIWVGRSWPIPDTPPGLEPKSEDTVFQQIVAKSNALRAFRVIVYSADPTAVADSKYQLTRWKGYVKPPTSSKGIEIGDLALEAMAVQSGGQVFNAISNLVEELDRCVVDADDFYTISFDPTPAAKPNEYHPLTVSVTKPGVTVHTRNGYYAKP